MYSIVVEISTPDKCHSLINPPNGVIFHDILQSFARVAAWCGGDIKIHKTLSNRRGLKEAKI